ncbi:glycosyltransferase [Cytobacillus firmus]|uniref:CgeB family protein n=1 Tax=Cytobacillus firmus TaxID=1399 RepID=UPI0037497BB0
MAINLKDLRVACILDEFSYECFKHECTLIKIGPNDWKKTLTRERPHFLFVESAWRGNDSSWQYKIRGLSKEIISLVEWCKKNNIPTVFWNKEDPVHFDNFIQTAKLFDYVYTTDESIIPKYKNELSHTNIYSLPFAAQPQIHNPISRSKQKNKNICFAGSYYGNQHLERTIDMENMLSISSKYGLDIYDRNYSIRNSPFKYPGKFQRYVKGSLPYYRLIERSKSYKICLNVNTVKESPTMCSRRVFELLASGVYVISNYSKAVKHYFSDIVYVAQDQLSLSQGIEKALNDSNWRTKKELQGIRNVLEHHTYSHRLYTIAKNCKLRLKPLTIPRIKVFSLVNTYKEAINTINSYKRQKYKYKDLTLIIPSKSISQSIKTLAIENDINLIIRKGTNIQLSSYAKGYDYVSYMSCTSYYGPHFLTDLVNGLKYSNAPIIAKNSYFEINDKGSLQIKNNSNSFFKTLNNSALIIPTSIIKNKNILVSDFLNLDALQQKTFSYKKFSVNPYNFIPNIPLGKVPSESILKEINL